MINPKYFLKGVLCSRKFDSPAIALGASFIAIGALLKNLGFTIQESIFSTFLTYALPGSLVMAESMLIGASLINIFLAVWLVNSRLYPMTVSIMPLLKHESQPRWKYYLSCHFVAVSSWLILKSNYEEIEKNYRIVLKLLGIGLVFLSLVLITGLSMNSIFTANLIFKSIFTFIAWLIFLIILIGIRYFNISIKYATRSLFMAMLAVLTAYFLNEYLVNFN